MRGLVTLQLPKVMSLVRYFSSTPLFIVVSPALGDTFPIPPELLTISLIIYLFLEKSNVLSYSVGDKHAGVAQVVRAWDS